MAAPQRISPRKWTPREDAGTARREPSVSPAGWPTGVPTAYRHHEPGQIAEQCPRWSAHGRWGWRSCWRHPVAARAPPRNGRLCLKNDLSAVFVKLESTTARPGPYPSPCAGTSRPAGPARGRTARRRGGDRHRQLQPAAEALQPGVAAHVPQRRADQGKHECDKQGDDRMMPRVEVFFMEAPPCENGSVLVCVIIR